MQEHQATAGTGRNHVPTMSVKAGRSVACIKAAACVFHGKSGPFLERSGDFEEIDP